MGLSPAAANHHIASQSADLLRQWHPYRSRWPAHVFHHSPFENALSILREGMLRSRNDPANHKAADVAAPGVIDTTAVAHDKVRFYFRPRTPTQYSIEGIRKSNECPYGESTHAPLLVMFVFDAKAILTRPDVCFSDQNMQIAGTTIGSDLAYFQSIPFEKVYHVGGFNGDHSILKHRHAEVMTSSPLALAGCLKALCFRSEPERDTMLNALADHADQWIPYCSVSDDLAVFEKRHTFVEQVSLSNKGILFRLNRRHDNQNVDIRIKLSDELGNVIVDFFNESIQATPPNGGSWIVEKLLNDGRYLVEVRIHNHLAFMAPLNLGSTLF